jgi:hypothetical protein
MIERKAPMEAIFLMGGPQQFELPGFQLRYSPQLGRLFMERMSERPHCSVAYSYWFRLL